MGRYSFMASTAVEPTPQERPTEAREKELSGPETHELFGGTGERRLLDGPDGDAGGMRKQ